VSARLVDDLLIRRSFCAWLAVISPWTVYPNRALREACDYMIRPGHRNTWLSSTPKSSQQQGYMHQSKMWLSKGANERVQYPGPLRYVRARVATSRPGVVKSIACGTSPSQLNASPFDTHAALLRLRMRINSSDPCNGRTEPAKR